MISREVHIVGSHFRGVEVVDLCRNLTPGTALTLEREPDNAHDEDAIKVLCEGTHIAYIPRNEAARWARYLDAGYVGTAVVVAAGNRPLVRVSITPDEEAV